MIGALQNLTFSNRGCERVLSNGIKGFKEPGCTEFKPAIPRDYCDCYAKEGGGVTATIWKKLGVDGVAPPAKKNSQKGPLYSIQRAKET